MTTEDNRLITLAIHTFEHSLGVKSLLESEGIDVVLQNVNLENPEVSAGVRIRIHESDLPAALRIIEDPDWQKAHLPSYTPTILFPTDFSAHSLRALDLAFEVALHHSCGVTILHSFYDPKYPSGLQLTKTLNFSNPNLGERHKLERKAWLDMKRFTDMIERKISGGELPKVKYKTILREGVPEENVVQMAKELNPLLIVMGTRDSDLKERDTMGSVTAEVLDNCSYPVFAVSDTTSSLASKRNIIMLCTLDQTDLLAIDNLMKLIDNENRQIYLVSLPPRKSSENRSDILEALRSYCEKHYTGTTFGLLELQFPHTEATISKFVKDNEISLVVVPNRKKNVFARLFNPGLAHRLIFQSNMPLIAVPV